MVSSKSMQALLAVVQERPSNIGEALGYVAIVHAAKPRLSKSQWTRLRNAARVASFDAAGLIDRRKNRITGHDVGIYDSMKQGIESDPEEIKRDGMKYSVVCEEHGGVVCVPSIAKAREVGSGLGILDVCEDCRYELDAKKVVGA